MQGSHVSQASQLSQVPADQSCSSQSESTTNTQQTEPEVCIHSSVIESHPQPNPNALFFQPRLTWTLVLPHLRAGVLHRVVLALQMLHAKPNKSGHQYRSGCVHCKQLFVCTQAQMPPNTDMTYLMQLSPHAPVRKLDFDNAPSLMRALGSEQSCDSHHSGPGRG